MVDRKLEEALRLLKSALAAVKKGPKDPLRLAALSKTFEVTFEYAWKLLKREADKAGLEVYSPRDTLKAAAQLRLIDDLELWNQLLNARNLSVHDYVGMDDVEMQPLVQRFPAEVERLLR